MQAAAQTAKSAGAWGGDWIGTIENFGDCALDYKPIRAKINQQKIVVKFETAEGYVNLNGDIARDGKIKLSAMFDFVCGFSGQTAVGVFDGYLAGGLEVQGIHHSRLPF